MTMTRKKAEKMCSHVPFIVYCDGIKLDNCIGFDVKNGVAEVCTFEGQKVTINKKFGRIDTKLRF